MTRSESIQGSLKPPLIFGVQAGHDASKDDNKAVAAKADRLDPPYIFRSTEVEGPRARAAMIKSDGLVVEKKRSTLGHKIETGIGTAVCVIGFILWLPEETTLLTVAGIVLIFAGFYTAIDGVARMFTVKKADKS
jgi:hypothetical protein